MNDRRRGSINVGEPLVVVSVVGAVALGSAWEHLGIAGRALGAVGLLVVGAAGLTLSARPSGMAGRCDLEAPPAREEPDDAREDR